MGPNDELEEVVEIVQVSMYCDIIKNLLAYHRSMSIVKVAAFSFTIKKVAYLHSGCFTGKNRTDLVLKFLSQVSGCYEEFCSQLPYILEAIDLLIKTDFCELHESELLCNQSSSVSAEDYGSFTRATIEESTSYTNRQFWKEVLSIV